MNKVNPPIKKYIDSTNNEESFILIKKDVQLVSSIVSYEDPYQELYKYMIEESDYA